MTEVLLLLEEISFHFIKEIVFKRPIIDRIMI